jgi:hypothetical protein
MTLISGADDEGGPHISGWPDSGGVAVITWRELTGQIYEQEVPDEDEALQLLQRIDDDDQLVLISAQLRRLGTGPAG